MHTFDRLVEDLRTAARTGQFELTADLLPSPPLAAFLSMTESGRLSLAEPLEAVRTAPRAFELRCRCLDQYPLWILVDGDLDLTEVTLRIVDEQPVRIEIDVTGGVRVGPEIVEMTGTLGTESALKLRATGHQRPIGLYDLASVAADVLVERAVPALPEPFDAVHLTALELDLGLTSDDSGEIRFAARSAERLALIPDAYELTAIKMIGGGRYATMAGMPTVTSWGSLRGELVVAGLPVRAEIPWLGRDRFALELSAPPDGRLPDLRDAARIVGGEALIDVVEEGLRQMGISDIVVTALSMDLAVPPATRHRLTLTTELRFRTWAFITSLTLPTLALEGRLKGEPPRLKSLLESILGVDTPFDELRLSALQFTAFPRRGEFVLSASVVDAWEVAFGPLRLALTAVGLEVGRRAPPIGLYATLGAQIRIGSVAFFVRAASPGPDNPDWEFCGGLADGHISLTELLTGMAEALGIQAFPALPALELVGLQLTWRPGAASFRITAESYLEVPIEGGEPLVIRLGLDIAWERALAGRLHGVLWRGPAKLELEVQLGNSVQITGGLPVGHTVRLGELIEAFVPAAAPVPAGFHGLVVHTTRLEWTPGADKFGLDIDTRLDDRDASERTITIGELTLRVDRVQLKIVREPGAADPTTIHLEVEGSAELAALLGLKVETFSWIFDYKANKWSMAGTLALSIYDSPPFGLRARLEIGEEEALTFELFNEGALVIPGLGAMTMKTLGFGLSRKRGAQDEADRRLRWRFNGGAVLTLEPDGTSLRWIQTGRFALESGGQPHARAFAFIVDSADMFSLPFGRGLALGKPHLELTASHDGARIVPSAILAGTLALGGAELTGTLTLKNGGGSLSLVQGPNPLRVTEVIAGFVPGGIALPSEIGGLEQLTVRGISGGFDLATQNYHFTGQATLERFTLGPLSVPRASGTIAIVGTGTRLERFSVEFAAEVAQELVPALRLDSVRFALELQRVGDGWQWHVGGELVVGLFDLPRQTLRADASNGEFKFSVQSARPLAWSLPGAPEVLSLSFERIALTLARDAVSKRTEWSFEGTGGLQLALLPRVSGTLGLYFEDKQQGFVFTADRDQGELNLTVPLVPGDDRMTVGCRFRADKLALIKRTEWELSAASRLTWVVPKPGAPDSSDPVDRALQLLADMFAQPTTAAIAATSSGVALIVSELPRVPVPIPVMVGPELAWKPGSVGLARLELKVGKMVSGRGDFRIVVPEEINNIFGQDPANKPKTRVFNKEWLFGLTIDEKAGLSLHVESLPINLEATTYFKDEKDGDRTWSRFTLGDVFSLRYGTFGDPQNSDERWIHVDLFDLGEIRMQQPGFSFNGADFSAKIDVDVVRALRIPTAPLRWLLTQVALQDLADVLPSHIPLLDIHILDPVSKAFDAGRFVDTLQSLATAMQTELPGLTELRTIANVLAGQFNQLPQDLRSYLDVTIPSRLDVAIAVTPATGFGVKFDIRAPKDPLRLIVPHPLAIFGVTLRQLSFGEILSGNLLLVAADLDIDYFDMPSLVASLALPAAVSGHLTDTPSIQRKLIVGNVLCLVVYQTTVPIPIPIWFDVLGFKYYGLEGVRSQLVLGNNLAGITMGKLFKGLADLFKEFRRFFTQADYALPDGLFTRNNINMGVHVKPGFVQLPKYLGGALLGSEQELLNLGVEQLLVPIVNFIKKPDVGALLAVIPFKHRHGSVGIDAPLRIGPFETQAAWLLATPEELDRLVQARGVQQNSFVESLYKRGDSEGNAIVGLLADATTAVSASQARDGVVVFLKGGVQIGEHLLLDLVTATTWTSAGFATGTAMRARLADLFDFKLTGGVRIAAGAHGTEFGLAGACSLTLFDAYPVLQGDVTMALGDQSHLRFDGFFDLFPDARSPIQLYSGEARGKKSRMTGILDARGIHFGSFDPDGSIRPAGVHLHVGDLYLGGTARIVNTAERQEWALELACLGAVLSLRARGRDIPEGRELQFVIGADRALGVKDLLAISGDLPDSGPSGELLLRYPHGSGQPELRALYLDGEVALLGLRSRGRVSIDARQFEFAVSSELGILATQLQVKGPRLDDPNGWTLRGDLDVARGLARVGVDLSLKDSVFRGGGTLEFWGAKRMDLTLAASMAGDAPSFAASGRLELCTSDGRVGLRSELRGSITKDALALAGAVEFGFFELKATGRLAVDLRAGGSLALGGTMAFAAGLLGGVKADVAARWQDGALELRGSCAAALRLIPGVLELSASSTLVATVSERPELQLSGELQVLGARSTYDLRIVRSSFRLTCDLALPLLDLSFAAETTNLASPADLRMSGRIAVVDINAGIKNFFAAIFGRLDEPAGMRALPRTPDNAEKLVFLRDMNRRWGSNGFDPDGYYYCVPPIQHVEFWSESRWWWMFGVPRYSKEDVSDIKKYYRFSADLGIPVVPPRQHDVGRLLNGILHAFLDLIKVVRDFVLEIRSITFTGVPVTALRTARFTVKVEFVLFGQCCESVVDIDLMNPVASLLGRLRDRFSGLVQGVIPRIGVGAPVADEDDDADGAELPRLGMVDLAADKTGAWTSPADGKTWWRIDLGGPRSLSAVDLRIDRGPATDARFEVWAANYEDMRDRVVLGGSADSQGPAHRTFSFSVVDAVPLRYVAVRTDAPRSFDIADLRAYARPPDLVVGKPVTATANQAHATRANDGGSCASGGWELAGKGHWQVDLARPCAVAWIELVTRQDRDAPEERRNFEIWGSDRADMQGHVVLARQGADALAARSVLRCVVEDPALYRHIRVVKTVDEPFSIAKFHVYEALPSAPLVAVYSAERQVEVLFARLDEPLRFGVRSGQLGETNAFAAAGNVRSFASAMYSKRHNRVEVFMRGADGMLHRFYSNNYVWIHDRATFVGGGPVGGPISAVYAEQRQHSEVYYRDTDGWVRFFFVTGERWQHDASSFTGVGPGRSRGALSALYSPSRGHAELFMTGEDGYLHYCYAEGNRWVHESSVFDAAGEVGGAISGVFSPRSNHAEVFFRGKDGGLHFFLKVANAWRHEGAELGAGRVVGDVCAVYAPHRGHSEVFFHGADGLVHHCRFVAHTPEELAALGPGVTDARARAGKWRHDSTSFHSAGEVNGPIAAIYNHTLARIEVYFVGEDGRMRCFVDVDGAWRQMSPAPPRPLFLDWTADLPQASSPVWRGAYAVRYAVEFEYADGSSVRSGWWHDGDGYVTSDRAFPVMLLPCDPLGQAVARRVVRQFRGLPERSIARISNNFETAWADKELGAVDMPPPAPTHNCWSSYLPIAGSPAWQPGFGVRYAMAYEYADGTVVQGDWWPAPGPQGAEVYASTGAYAMPVLNIATDPTGQVVARRMIRQFRGLPARTLARIADNAVAAWLDDDRGIVDMPPSPPVVHFWTEAAPAASSPVWVPGRAVRYALEYEYADGAVVRGDWWRTSEPQDGAGYTSFASALPALDIACDPTGQVVARRVIRQFRGLPERMLARIADNTETAWVDTDRGAVEMPPPPPTFERWTTNVPVTGSPTWQPGHAVRYAVAYEYADGTVIRGGWWHASDSSGYASDGALPRIKVPRDEGGQVVARHVIRQFRGLPERAVARLPGSADLEWMDDDRGGADWPPPPPTFNYWLVELPLAGSPIWRTGNAVRYAVEYEYIDGSVVRGDWWGGGAYYDIHRALPHMNIPCDPTGQVTARRMVREFRGLPARMVARIANNSDTAWLDTDRGAVDVPPPPPTVHSWTASSPLAGSPLWRNGWGVRYAMEFEYADGTVVRGAWWRGQRDDTEGFVFPPQVLPRLNIPRDPSEQIVARRVVRQFHRQPARTLVRIANNTDTIWHDTDTGVDDWRPSPPVLRWWQRVLPVAGSPVWKVGYGVRYAVEFEYDDGTLVRSDWWRPDGDGYGFEERFGMPQMAIRSDTSGQVAARRIVRQFHGLPERTIARIGDRQDLIWSDTDHGFVDVPPAAPTLQSWTEHVPVASSPTWRPGFGVRYAVEYEYPDGTVVRGDWWPSEGWASEGALPMLTLACDASDSIAARRIVRQFRGLPARVIARIPDNTTSSWTDTDRGAADMPPAPPTLNFWGAHLPLAGSPTWRHGYGVRYAVEFIYADGTAVRSGWWRAVRQDEEGYGSHDYSLPNMNLPGDPSGQVVARRVIRQFRGLPERVVARLVDHGESTWLDTDNGVADVPPPPPPVRAEPEPEPIVVLYSDAHFTGYSQAFGPGRYDVDQLSFGNDQLSSLRVPPGWSVTLYEHAGFSGNATIFTADNRFVGDFNDKTSSLVVRKVTAASNVAAGKPARASSEWSAEHTASHANPIVHPGSGGWSPRGEDDAPWWQVDLGRPHHISRIELVTRQENDQPVTRRNFAIWLADDPDMRDHVVVAQQGDAPLSDRATFIAEVDPARAYRHVRVAKTVAEYFFIGELRVLAEPQLTKDTPPHIQPEPEPGPSVLIFSDANFTGYSQAFGPGRYDVDQLSFGNDQLSSLRVPPGWTVTLYEHSGFIGVSRVFTADTWFVGDFNDRTSSLIVRSTTPSNVAAGKPARASSEWSAEHTASHANPVVHPGSGGWSPRGEDDAPWWQVDLGRPHHISRIELVTRQENNQPVTRRNFAIWLADDPDMRDHVVVAQQGDAPLPDRATFTADIDPPRTYRHVRVVKTGSEYFFIGELRVLAEPDTDSGVADTPPPHIHVEPEPEPGPSVLIYSDANFTGYNQAFGPGRYDVDQLSIGNDQLSSLRVPPGWTVTLYEHAGFIGINKVFTADAWFVGDFNDRTSSLIVRSTTPSNVAAGKPARASSEWSAEHTAGHANPVVHPGSGGWSPRGEDDAPWWQVDLGHPHPISRIELVTRQENNQPVTRRNFAIWLADDPDMRDHVVVGQQHDAPIPDRATFTADIDPPRTYRYVRVVKTVAEYFFIGELRVLAES